MSEVFQGYIWLMGGFAQRDSSENARNNLNDIWITKDGINWEKYMPLNPWSIRHASYHTVFKNKIWLMGGFDNFELSGFHNDIWTFEPKSIFLGQNMNPAQPQSWYFSSERTGPVLESFDENSQYNAYIIGDYNDILLSSKVITGSTNNIFIGDGIRQSTVSFSFKEKPKSRIFVTATGHLIFNNQKLLPDFELIQHSKVSFQNFLQLNLPDREWWNLSLKQSKILSLPILKVLQNLEMVEINLPKQELPLQVHVGGSVKMGGIPTFLNMTINGIGSFDQEFESVGERLNIDNLRLKKSYGNFIFKGNFQINKMLNIGR
jgi:hypothetical protein